MIAYLKPFQELLEANAQAENAVAMKAYMKNRFEFYGIKSPERRELEKQFLSEFGMPKPFDKKVFRELWKANQREFQHFGLDILRKQAKQASEKDLALIEELIITKSWWDTVDGLASWICGPYFLKFPERMKPVTDAWTVSENMWLRRTSIIFQLGYKQKTDVEILTDHIEKNLGSKEFFINKAIGWALREYAKTDSKFVRDYVERMKEKLHPLSVREALKNL
ncbi:MAG: DNA alkylation repair protein [Flavobacteriales bacterium]|jgi:3-methyladenine DNA glycosylase AlkD|nr:DNA alkylation repair protein [Flavobacteriales bacterium]